jgi:hypothetical protein
MQSALGRYTALVCALALSGCASLKESPVWPRYEKSWCYPKAKYTKERKRYYAGVSCRW